jgi:anti-sigma regulatory factor (Ser/Thr protein kinase)
VTGNDHSSPGDIDSRRVPVPIGVLRDVLEAVAVAGEDRLETNIELVYASDLMSDVLAFGRPNSMLLTGLATQQAVISAHMAEFKAVVFIRGKKAKESCVRVARDNNLVLMTTQLDMYDACIRVDAARQGGSPGAARLSIVPAGPDRILLSKEFPIVGGDFATAGFVSTEVKSILKKIGFDPRLIRKVAISAFEAEMNVVMHAKCGMVKLDVSPTVIHLVVEDQGPGIRDITLAMQEGFTTATEEMRAMGFGSGMGLPNIRRNSDDMQLLSEVGRGTTLKLRFDC